MGNIFVTKAADFTTRTVFWILDFADVFGHSRSGWGKKKDGGEGNREREGKVRRKAAAEEITGACSRRARRAWQGQLGLEKGRGVAHDSVDGCPGREVDGSEAGVG